MDPKWLLTAMLTILLLGCAGKPVHQSRLIGYQDGKMRMIYTVALHSIPMKSGGKGYRYDFELNYSVGNKDRLESVKQVFMNHKFEIDSSQTRRDHNGQITEIKLQNAADQLSMWKKEPGQEPLEKTINTSSPFVEPHPMLYGNDLTVPGGTKTYNVFSDSKQEIVPLTIRFLGQKTLSRKNRTFPAAHYQLESIANPGTYSDYYLDPETKDLLCIKMDPIEFWSDRFE